VPTITRNLLSVSKFAKDNLVYFEFHADKCFVKSQESKQVLLEGFLDKSGLYKFSSFPLKSSRSAIQSHHTNIFLIVNTITTTASNTDSSLSLASLWHSRLGHSNQKVVSHVLTLCNIHLSNKSTLEFCNSCCLGKSQRLHAPASNTVYSAPFEVIHTDLWGPSPSPSSCGYSYYIAFVDAFTKYTKIYF